jgi:hypothetical protein
LRQIYRRLKSEWARYIAKFGVFAITVALFSYWISYQDRIANRQNTAWENLRDAISWVDGKNHWGNAGQVGAIQTLTHDCDRSGRNTFLRPVIDLIFPYCVDLNSLALKKMELGSLQAAGANFSHSDISCANLPQANLRDANLEDVDLGGSNLAGADLRGAHLSADDPQDNPSDDANLWLTDLSWVKMDSSTKVDLSKLKCACIQQAKDTQGNIGPATGETYVTSSTILAELRGLHTCPVNKCDPKTLNSWKCEK